MKNVSYDHKVHKSDRRTDGTGKKTLLSRKSSVSRPGLYQSTYPHFIFTVAATFTGVIIGVIAALGIVKADVSTQVSAATTKLAYQVTSLSSAHTNSVDGLSNPTQCPVPAGSAAGSKTNATAPVITASALPANPGQGVGGTVQGSAGNSSAPQGPTFVHKLVSGIFANDTASITNTGPDSFNNVKFDNTVKTTVTNNNNLNLTNTTSQSSDSGNASVVKNTTAGDAATGDATNNSNTAVQYRVTN